MVDAHSGQSGSESRDSRMHKSIIESSAFPDVIFTPDRVDGHVPTQGAGTIQVHGTFILHGTRHELTLPIQLNVAPGQFTADTRFNVPYISWGLKNPSTFVLRVSDKDEVEIHSTATVAAH